MVTSVSYDTAACEGMVVVTEEMEGQWAGQISLQAGPNTISGWTVEMEFTSSVDWIESVMAQVDILYGLSYHHPPVFLPSHLRMRELGL